MTRMHRHLRSTLDASALLSLSFFLLFFGQSAHAQHTIASMVDWAVAVDELARGPIDIANPGLGLVTYGAEADVLGAALGDELTVLSLGDGGFITLEIGGDGIGDGPGDDFAVFENGFFTTEGLFGELAFVEVSSNGVDFARFDTATTATTPVPTFGSILPTDYDGFAGLHPAGLGTGFDLADLVGHPLEVSGDLDLDAVLFVRIVDVIGDGTAVDSNMATIYDPYATPFLSGGFDLDGVGVLNVPEPTQAAMLCAGIPGLAYLAGLARRRRPTAPPAT